MAKFMFVFRGGGYAKPDSLSPSELQAHLAKWNAWNEALIAAGKHVSGTPLAFPGSGQTVRGKDRIVTDGPYAESKDLVSGILVVETADLTEATKIAGECPILSLDGSVEVRPVLEGPPK